jgi:hypothetical protein
MQAPRVDVPNLPGPTQSKSTDHPEPSSTEGSRTPTQVITNPVISRRRVTRILTRKDDSPTEDDFPTPTTSKASTPLPSLRISQSTHNFQSFFSKNPESPRPTFWTPCKIEVSPPAETQPSSSGVNYDPNDDAGSSRREIFHVASSQKNSPASPIVNNPDILASKTGNGANESLGLPPLLRSPLSAKTPSPTFPLSTSSDFNGGENNFPANDSSTLPIPSNPGQEGSKLLVSPTSTVSQARPLTPHLNSSFDPLAETQSRPLDFSPPAYAARSVVGETSALQFSSPV